MFPNDLQDKFYQQFPDPLRAYWNLPGLYKFYAENPDRKPPADDDTKYTKYAYELAQEARK